MTLVLLLSAIGALLLPALARSLGRRLPPAEWARLCIVLLAVGATAVEVALLVIGLTSVLDLAGVHAFADLCERMLGTALPGGALSGLAAAAAAVLLASMATRQMLRARRTRRAVRVEPTLGRHRAGEGHDLVVLPSRRLFAYGIAGQPSQVVVSDGLVGTLAEHELAAVLRHEATHLRHHHQRHLLVASVVEHTLGAVPLVRRSAAVLRCALERWADEEAATSEADRASVRSPLVRVTEALMLRRVVRWIIAGVALALALHLYMLSGHSHQAHGPLAPLEAASHQGVATAHRQGMGAELRGLERAVDMLASCLAIVSTLVLGASFRRRIRPPRLPVEAAAPRHHRGLPRARAPVELCVSRR